MMKYEWRKNEKSIYGAKDQPEFIVLPSQNYITIKGKGNPNHDNFLQRVGVLYSMSYQVKSIYKGLCAKEPEKYAHSGYNDYTVFPLEGIWTSSSSDPLDKDCFIYTIMIKQPEGITKEMFEAALQVVEKKKPHPLLKEVAFEAIEDGECVQMMHKGPFDDEPLSFAKMDEFIRENGGKRLNPYHREIYLTDARKTAPEKKKTILRYQISRNS